MGLLRAVALCAERRDVVPRSVYVLLGIFEDILSAWPRECLAVQPTKYGMSSQ